MFGNFVFDIDGAVAIVADYEKEKVEKDVKKKLGIKYFKKHCLVGYGYPHYIFPGYYALFKWLHSKGGKIIFFSSGIEERNIDIVDKIMKMSFGDSVSEVEYKVFSRHHCIDTNLLTDRGAEKYQSHFYGQRKKKLAGIVVPEEELPHTLLIDDDNSYMVKGEEYNFVYLRYCYQYLQEGRYRESESFTIFHRAYYLAGLFSKIFNIREEKNISLVEAAKYVQIDFEGKELSRDFYYPGTERIEYYINGLDILNQIDPALKFYYDIPKLSE
ncbi:MAG: hypothetical protein HY738_00140 [Bacteroidia bacterium]|nr:hypothetical protein [Bacteroidia bacterium]